jgi:ATP-binding protein involved in chromosome partitioning
MVEITETDVLQALQGVEDPELHKDFVELNMIRDVRISGGVVSMSVILTTPACPLKDEIGTSIRGALTERIPGVSAVNIDFGSQVIAFKGIGDKAPIEGVKNVIAVGSGKGGVGKSTVAVNVAVALAQSGARVGLLDADIYGPNTPMMLGVKYRPVQTPAGKLVPAKAHGLELFSMGFMVKDEQPIIWRGPMLDKAIRQFLSDVDWGDLDYLIVDMPPGTGDAQLTVSQAFSLAGGLIVTLPQAVSQADARRGLEGFKMMEVPVLGVVENMSYLAMPDGSRMDIFGQGGGRHLAEAAGVPFIGEIPIDAQVRIGGDSGVPIVVSHPQSAAALALVAVAQDVAAKVSVLNFLNQNNVIPITEIG